MEAQIVENGWLSLKNEIFDFNPGLIFKSSDLGLGQLSVAQWNLFRLLLNWLIVMRKAFLLFCSLLRSYSVNDVLQTRFCHNGLLLNILLIILLVSIRNLVIKSHMLT